MEAKIVGFDRNWWRKVTWYPMLLAPLVTGASVAISVGRPAWFQGLQVWLEEPAPYLVGAAAAIYAARAVWTFNPLYWIVAVLGAALTCREIHFAGTSRGLYVALAVLAGWAVAWRGRLYGPLGDWRHTSWLLATLAGYFLSQLVARRAFKFIPGEHAIHRSLEECAETAAHAMFIVTALVGNWRRYGRRAAAVGRPATDSPPSAEDAG